MSLSRPTVAVCLTLALAGLAGCSSASDTGDESAPTESAQESSSSTPASTDAPTTAPPPTETSESTQPSPGPATTATGAGGTLSGQGYTVTIPASWEDATQAAKQINPTAEVAMAEPQGDGFRTNFNVVEPNPVPDSLTDAQLTAQAANELESVTRNEVVRVDAPDFDGDPALGQSSTTKASGTDLTLIQYFVIHDGFVYACTMTFESSRADEADFYLGEIIGSWTWSA